MHFCIENISSYFGADMVPSTNRSGHRLFKAEMPGSNPAGITIYRIGVTAARLTLTQEVVVQIHDPEPYMGLIQR